MNPDRPLVPPPLARVVTLILVGIVALLLLGLTFSAWRSIRPGYVGIVSSQNPNQVVVRFDQDLPSDTYDIHIAAALIHLPNEWPERYGIDEPMPDSLAEKRDQVTAFVRAALACDGTTIASEDGHELGRDLIINDCGDATALASSIRVGYKSSEETRARVFCPGLMPAPKANIGTRTDSSCMVILLPRPCEPRW